MRHLGDVTKLNGADVPPVNVIIGGSPCQDLSIAGKRAGLEGERSGLFMDQIRIIKEMRAKYGKPRFMVWENVPGAFSSNKGADFGAVIQETARVVVKEAPAVPVPEKGWPTAGCVSGMGDGGVSFSIAWRVFDAQFWGVPQRRRRIALVADFGGLTAPEILFERESVPGDPETGGETRESASADAERGAERNDSLSGSAAAIDARNGTISDRMGTLQTKVGKSLNANGVVMCLNPWDIQSKHIVDPSGVAEPLYAGECRGGGGEAYVMQPTYCIQGNSIDRADNAGCNGKGWTEGKSYTLNTIDRPAVTQKVGLLNDQGGSSLSGEDNAEVAPTIRAEMHGNVPAVVYDARGNGDGKTVPTMTGDHENRITDYTSVVVHAFAMNGFRGDYKESETASTLKQRDYKDATDLIIETPKTLKIRSGCEGGGKGALIQDDRSATLGTHNDQTLLAPTDDRSQYIVRRLTPMECERLQGFPDGWTDIGAWSDTKGKDHKESTDSARYKALGNSIALPPWIYVLMRLSACCRGDWTMASLFDGIGGFPLIWETLHGKGTCVWASEIEEFPIAVTERRING